MDWKTAIRILRSQDASPKDILDARHVIVTEVTRLCKTPTDYIEDWLFVVKFNEDDTPTNVALEWDKAIIVGHAEVTPDTSWTCVECGSTRPGEEMAYQQIWADQREGGLVCAGCSDGSIACAFFNRMDRPKIKRLYQGEKIRYLEPVLHYEDQDLTAYITFETIVETEDYTIIYAGLEGLVKPVVFESGQNRYWATLYQNKLHVKINWEWVVTSIPDKIQKFIEDCVQARQMRFIAESFEQELALREAYDRAAFDDPEGCFGGRGNNLDL